MEILFAALGVGCFLVAGMAWVLCRSAALGDRMARPPKQSTVDPFAWGEPFDEIEIEWPDYRKDAG